MPEPAVEIPRDKVAEFCARHHVNRLSLFGSVLGPEFRGDSDVDFLVEFEPEHVPGYFRLVGMEMELSEIIGRKADLRTPGELSPRFRDRVVAGAALQYARH